MIRTWFITGTSRGFGREWTIAALERGDQVVATARDAASLDDLVPRYPDHLLALTLDVDDKAAVEAAVTRAVDLLYSFPTYVLALCLMLLLGYGTRSVALAIALHAPLAAAAWFWPAHWPWWLAALAALHALVTVCGLLPRCGWLGTNWTRLPAAARARGEIAITIDDGPDAQVTPQVLDVLDRFGARVTFFCIGRQAAQQPALCRAIVARGHALDIVKKVERLLYLAEYKRRQSAPGVKVTLKNFGRDRRYPIVNRFRDPGTAAQAPDASLSPKKPLGSAERFEE